MMQNLVQNLKLACIATSAMTLISCGGDGGLLGGVSGNLGQSAANILKGQLGSQLPSLPTGNNGVPDLGNIQGLPGGGVSTASVGTRAFGCETEDKDATDNDGDGFAVSKVTTYDCTDYSSGGNFWDISGTVTSQDKNDSVAGLRGGYYIGLDLNTHATSNDGTDLVYTTKGAFDATTSGNTTTYTSNFKQNFKGTVYEYSQLFQINYKFATDYTITFTGSNTSGNVTIDGLIGIDGVVPSSGNLEELKATMIIRSVNLTYSNACSQYYNSGDVEYVDGSGNILKVTYGCGSATWYYNGTAL